MLNEKALLAIEEMVEIIYSPDQEELDQEFIKVLDAFEEMVKEMETRGYYVDMTEELGILQTAYLKKDYIELADVLLYDVKPELEQISI
jgi:hypothetical protein